MYVNSLTYNRYMSMNNLTPNTKTTKKQKHLNIIDKNINKT